MKKKKKSFCVTESSDSFFGRRPCALERLSYEAAHSEVDLVASIVSNQPLRWCIWAASKRALYREATVPRRREEEYGEYGDLPDRVTLEPISRSRAAE